MYYTDKRHESGGKAQKPSEDPASQEEWRVKSRIKTVYAGLMMCLNIGVDPPDIVKTNPTATLEAWTDPSAPQPNNGRVLDLIGKNLQQQYETLSIRIRYRQFLDPSVDETRRCCVQLRKSSRDERVLFHYNGHGVPLPTSTGEIWYFNRNYTQYIPVSLYDLQLWLGGPSIYVLDIGHAGSVVANFDRMIQKHEQEDREKLETNPDAQTTNYGENIILAACGKGELLPTNPDLPADMFTACLTTPVQISLRCFVLQSQTPLNVTLKDLEKVPGRLQERRTPLGELNWIFTAITDTIAWNCLPREMFKTLFRQDLMVAALFRNYLLADRLMRKYACNPMTQPKLPPTHEHPLWASWDLALEMVVSQLPFLIAAEDGGPPYEYQHSSFFTEQLTAFEVYLSQGALERKAPDQLPIVLQVLLSQVHRLRALCLLGRFLDLGPWAVMLALKIGIFPYVLKLLQSAAPDLKPVLIYIWTRILAVDPKCQTDLIRDNGYKYFLTTIQPDADLPVTNAQEHRAMALFIVSIFCHNYFSAQQVCLSEELFQACILHLADPDNPLLRQWACLCISVLWREYGEAKWMGIRANVHQHLAQMVLDPVPECRAAAIHALANFLGLPDMTDQVTKTEQAIAGTLVMMCSDGSNLVRTELLVFFSRFVLRYESKFTVVAFEELQDELRRFKTPSLEEVVAPRQSALQFGHQSAPAKKPEPERISRNSVFATTWKHLLILSVDPHPEIAQNASLVVDHVHTRLLESAIGQHAEDLMEKLAQLAKKPVVLQSRPPSPAPAPRLAEVPVSPTTGPPKRSESYLSLSLRRTASVVGALKSFATGSAPTPPDSQPASPASSRHTADHPRTSTTRQRVPDEWSKAPDAHDPRLNIARYQKAKVPQTKGFDPKSGDEEVSLPIKSEFFEWCTEYFREPQMKSQDMDEPGSDDYNQRLWRRSRNEKILQNTQPLKSTAGASKWDVLEGTITNQRPATKLCFQQFEEHLVVADDRDTLTIWNWQNKTRINRFSNANPNGSKITDLRFINEDDRALLMTGSSDGVVKVYRGYESEDEVEVVSAFRVLNDLVPSTKNVGLVLNWQQGQGKLFAAGDLKVIRVWNAATEICTHEIPTRSGSCITALTSDQVAGNVIVAGFGNGKVQVYDQRETPHKSMVMRYTGHKQWITNLHMQRGGMRELISGSRNGEVKLWDIRMQDELKTITATRNTLRALSVHEHAPVFAAGSDTHHVNFFNVNGTYLNSISAKGPVQTTAFHPHHMVLACSTLSDNHVNLYTCRDVKRVYGDV